MNRRDQMTGILELVNAHEGEYLVLRSRYAQTMPLARAIKLARRDIVMKYDRRLFAEINRRKEQKQIA